MTEAASPTPNPEPAPAAPAAAPTPPSAPAAFDWKGSGLDDASLAVVTEKGWKSPADLFGSYRSAEKLIGVPPEQVLKLPKEMTRETMAPIYDRLGRPKSADEYKLPVPEGQSPDFAKAVSGWMHELGLSAGQGQELANRWNGYFAEAGKAQMAEYTAKVDAEGAKLKTEWSANYDANVSIAKQAAKTFGMDEGQIAALEKSMGFAGVHKFLFNIGSKLGEAEFIQSGGKPGDFTGLSPELARARVADLKRDPTFVARWNSKDPVVKGEAQAEMKRLHKVAYPE